MSRLRVDDGATIYYETAGTGDDWLTLIHGGLVDSTSWAAVLNSLAAGRRLLAYDVRGFGRSDSPPGEYTLARSVADLAALWQNLGIGRSVVLGFSQGGVIAQGAAVAHPRVVAGLVLVGTFAYRTDQEREAALRRAADVERAGLATQGDVHTERVFSAPFREANPAFVSAYRARIAANDPHGFAATMRSINGVDLRPHLGKVDCPTLVLVGEHDCAVGVEHSRQLAAAVPGAILRIVAGAGHTVHIEQPDTFVELVNAFTAPIDHSQSA